MNRIKVVNSLDGRFEESVIAYLFIVNILPIIVIPLMWSESKKIAIVYNNWSDFEVLTMFPYMFYVFLMEMYYYYRQFMLKHLADLW